MQIVIDIPDEMYQGIKETFKVISGSRRSERFDYILFNAVNTGTPLPKGHGRLIDVDKLYEQEMPAIKKDGVVYIKLSTLQDLIDDAPTIIEADKE